MFENWKLPLIIGFLTVLSVLSIATMAKDVDKESAITQVDIIFDASGSMWGQIDGKCKITIAREAMDSLLGEFEKKETFYLGLRVYGHLNKQCNNSVAEIEMGPNNAPAIKKMITAIKPLGKTPIAYSLSESIKDFYHKVPGEKVVILITDGIESCDGNICLASKKLKEAGIVTKVHVVGFGMSEKEMKSLECIAKPFGGKVIGASNAKELATAFKEVTNEFANEKNLKVIGLDSNNKSISIDVEVYQDSTEIVSQEPNPYSSNNTSTTQKSIKVASNHGVEPKFALKPGVYTIKAKSIDGGAVVEASNVEIKKGEFREVTLLFQEGRIRLKSIDDKKRLLYGFYEIYRAGTEELVKKVDGSGVMEAVVAPGVYDIKVYEQNTYTTLWKKNIKVTAGETAEKTFLFRMGFLEITPTVAGGGLSTEYWWYYFYKNGSDEKEKTTGEGVGKEMVELTPGEYEIKVLDGYNKIVATIKATVVGGKTTKVSWSFAPPVNTQ